MSNGGFSKIGMKDGRNLKGTDCNEYLIEEELKEDA
jgi:hypothetical protein